MNAKTVYFKKHDRSAIVIAEARTPSWVKECVTCGQTFEQMMFILFSLHENGSQYVCRGWLCFDCDRKQQENDNAASSSE